MVKDIDFFTQNKLELLGMTLIQKDSLKNFIYNNTNSNEQSEISNENILE